MNATYDACLAVFNDVVYSQLHPKVKEQLEAAIKHHELAMPVVVNLVQRAQVFNNQMERAKTFTWTGFKQPQGRELSREVDGFNSCSNARRY